MTPGIASWMQLPRKRTPCFLRSALRFDAGARMKRTSKISANKWRASCGRLFPRDAYMSPMLPVRKMPLAVDAWRCLERLAQPCPTWLATVRSACERDADRCIAVARGTVGSSGRAEAHRSGCASRRPLARIRRRGTHHNGAVHVLASGRTGSRVGS